MHAKFHAFNPKCKVCWVNGPTTHQIRDVGHVEHMLVWCRADVEDDGAI